MARHLDDRIKLKGRGEGASAHASERVATSNGNESQAKAAPAYGAGRYNPNSPSDQQELLGQIIICAAEYVALFGDNADRSALRERALNEMTRTDPVAAAQAMSGHPEYPFLLREYEKAIEGHPKYQFYKQLKNKYNKLTPKEIVELEEFVEHQFTEGRDPIAQKLMELDARLPVAEGRQKASEIVTELFPELLGTIAESSVTLPSMAPASWAKGKQPGDTPPEFIRRHYAPWLGKGLTRPDIKRLDPQLYVGLNNWLRNNEMPADVDLPTLKEKNDRWVERVREGSAPGPLDLKGARRLVDVASRRQGGGTEKQ